MADIEMPWAHRTRSEQGMKSEKQAAKESGARLHPRSGAGKIKDDASNENTVFEFKLAGKTHQLKATDLLALFRRAVRANKDAVYEVYFDELDITITGKITKGRRTHA